MTCKNCSEISLEFFGGKSKEQKRNDTHDRSSIVILTRDDNVFFVGFRTVFVFFVLVFTTINVFNKQIWMQK